MVVNTHIHLFHRDPAVLRWLRTALRGRELVVCAHAGIHDVKCGARPAVRGCILADMDDPTCAWRELLALAEGRGSAPFVLLTAAPVVRDIVYALAHGAADVIDMRGDPGRLTIDLMRALGTHVHQRQTKPADPETSVRWKALTKRERDVFELVASGLASKVIAAKLSISKRTVDMHRHRILRKLNAKSTIAMVTEYARARECVERMGNASGYS